MTHDQETSSIVARLCVEQWKLLQQYAKTVGLVPDAEKNRLTSQIKYSEIQLHALAAEAGLKVISLDGEPFGPGSPATADNLEDFPSEDGLVVERTLSPAIVRDMRVIQMGRVLLALKS
ncbi:hypothetical protein ACQZ61_08410 [Agrobacterium vitis]|uniref:hypothetical protein n=1 Tax=Rhizobium/Agrobacterium group TaxID=227290 RepID=UPI0005A259FF|nr:MULTISPECIES: hypothetical protein [Rhizobium/Agrobacterium group]BCH54879.1 hypothetical protein RvVAR031_24890 [Agrobacterium vitis]